VLAGAGAAGLIQAGKLRALATTGARRSALFPDLAAVAEFYPGYEVTAWAGLFAPAGTPEAVVNELRTEVHRVLVDSDVVQKLTRAGPEPLVLSAQEFQAMIQQDYKKYGEVVKAIGLKIE
jgi:tripartite-type tricarboxylate transporter receptor subunit TctC